MTSGRRAQWPHGLAGLFVLGMVALAVLAPDAYYGLVQEDGPVEWLTVGLFLAAGVVRLRSAGRDRRVFDALVGVFCLFVAGEEVSWGQRLLGFTPPEYFLESNFQQEANLHNFADLFGRPGTVLAVLLVAYGVVLPLIRRTRRVDRFLERLGASGPGLAALPWFALAATLLLVYPVEFAGEWVEALAGGLFLATATTAPPSAWVAATVLGVVMPVASLPTRDAGGRLGACAQMEAEALLRDLVEGEAATLRLAGMRYVHKRVYSAVEAGYIEAEAAERYRSAPACGGRPADAAARRRYGVDPWGMSYWVVTDARGARIRVAVHSLGPNRRRDGEAGEAAGDDVVVYAELDTAAPITSR